MQKFRGDMKEKLSGIDRIQIKQYNREIIEQSDGQFFESNAAKLKFIQSKIKKLDPVDKIEHMFVEENTLVLPDEVPIHNQKKNMWGEVFRAVHQWPRYKDLHS
jgi:hypothetical protein